MKPKTFNIIVTFGVLILSTKILFGQIIEFEMQNFSPLGPNDIQCFLDLESGSVAFADVDGDNDQDVVIAGYNSDHDISNNKYTLLYINDGLGNYTLAENTPFEGISTGDIAFADIDGDNDQDLLITGSNNSNQRISNLYTNDGYGNFTLVSNTPFESISSSAIAFGDLDNDNDPDLIMTGTSDNSLKTSLLYINDGTGSYTLVSDTPFEAVYRSAVTLGDVDNDNDLDVFIAGNGAQPHLYINDGNASFTIVENTPFLYITNGDVALGDIDNDNDLDVLMTGSGAAYPITKLYKNDGQANFTLVENTPFGGALGSKVEFADADGDDDLDVFLIGDSYGPSSEVGLFINNGQGFFELFESNLGNQIYGDFAISDIDDDNDLDVIMTGTTLYANNGNGVFSAISDHYYYSVSSSSSAFSDVDGDNDQDVVICGYNGSEKTTSLCLNDGLGNFTLATNIFFKGVSDGAIVFADVNNDNNEDLFLTGYNNDGIGICELYLNDGTGNFSLSEENTFMGLRSSSASFGDVDGDNDLDLLLIGESNEPQATSLLYSNDGTGNFSLVTGTPFEGVYWGSVNLVDIEGDNDLDVLITGENNAFEDITRLYSNDGLGNFTLIENTPFANVSSSSVACADIDGDNDQDIFITGHGNSYANSKLYLNNGFGTFVLVDNTPFTNVLFSSVTFSDIDNDNDQDLLITGGTNGNGYTAGEVFSNDGNGNFTLAKYIAGLKHGSLSCADIDGDNDQDILVSGNYLSSEAMLFLYKTDISILPIEISLDSINGSSNGLCNGFIDVNISGGIPPYKFEWNNNDTTEIIDNLCSGTYNLTVSDFNDSIVFDSYEIGFSDTLVAFADTIFATIEDCIFNTNLPVDSAAIVEYIILETDSVKLFWRFWQSGDSILFESVHSIDTIGLNLIYLEIICNNKSINSLNIHRFYGTFYYTSSGINEITSISSLSIYPNPAKEFIVIKFISPINELAVLSLFDLSGKEILNLDFSNEIRLNTDKFEKGIYFLQVETNKDVITKKILIRQ